MDDETARVLITAGIGIAGALLGTYFGYRLRSREARRERQLAAYAEVAGSLVRAANAGAALQSVHLQLGETWRDPAHKATTAPLWSDWSETYQQFETACAIARMVGSSNGRVPLLKTYTDGLLRMSCRHRRTFGRSTTRAVTPRMVRELPVRRRCAKPASLPMQSRLTTESETRGHTVVTEL